MKTKGYIALFLFMAVTGLHGITFAQEGDFMMPDSEDSNTLESTRGENVRSGFNIDPATKKTDRATTNKKIENKTRFEEPAEKEAEVKTNSKKEADPQTTSTTNNSPKKTEENEDSVLSFNILYYMIQKFKFSDVIDQ